MKKVIIILLPACFIGLQLFSQVVPDSTATDSTLLKQITEQMQGDNQQPAPQQTRSAISANPDIGVVADFRTSYMSSGKKNLDAYLNETEVSLQSVVDPYIRADFFLSLSRDPATHKYGIEVEEGYLTTLTLPARLQLKVGKFRGAAGRINPVHPHALPFIDCPCRATLAGPVLRFPARPAAREEQHA